MKSLPLYFCLSLTMIPALARADMQTAVSSWGLDRVDQRTGIDGTYTYDYTGGNTIIYVVDQGVAEVPDLAGRISEHRAMRFTGPDNLYTLTSSINNHGTSVASAAAGATYGVAKGASIVDVRAWSLGTNASGQPVIGDRCYQYNSSTGQDDIVSCVVAAFNDIAARHPSGAKGVVNYSGTLGTGSTDRNVLRAAIGNLNGRGILVVVAATEWGSSACTTAPAEFGASTSGLSVVTVSAVEADDRLAVDESVNPDRYAGSGPCVDIFAASSTLAAGYGGGASVFQHTSSAAPFVSGAAALMFSQNPWMMPNDVEDLLKENATAGVLGNIPGDTVNSLLYTRLPVINLSATSAYPAETLTASVMPMAGASYLWTIQNGTILGSSTGSSISFRTGCPNQTTLKVRTTTGDGRSFSGFGAVQITPPTARVSGAARINAGQSATINLQLTGVGPWAVTWSDGVQLTYATVSATRTVSPTSTTTYRVLGVRDANGCAGTATGSATITVCPVNNTITAPAAGHASGAVSVSVPETTGATYQWSVTNGMIWSEGSTRNPTIILGCAGSTTATVTITTSCGIQSTSSKSIAINRPSVVVWNDSWIAPGETAIVAASFSGTPPFSVTFSDGVRITSINSYTYYYYVTPSTTTTYTATAITSKYGCLGTTSGSATVNVTP